VQPETHKYYDKYFQSDLASPYKDHLTQIKLSSNVVQHQHEGDGHEYILQGYSTLKKELETVNVTETITPQMTEDINEKSKQYYLEHSTDRNNNMLPN